MSTLLRMQNVIKSFEGSVALKNGRIEVARGEIHALIGANGAGKSTLMKILYGMLEKDSGNILFDGQEVRFKNVNDAKAAGIFMVQQELSVFGDLTIAGNIFLVREPMKGLSVDDARMNREAAELLAAVGLHEDPSMPMRALPPAKQQLVAIASLLSRDVKLIIFDEPTTALGETDVEKLFSLMRGFRDQGISMIFISHRLDELFEISDRITIMRDGAFVISKETKDLTKDELVYYMTGKEVRILPKEKSSVPEDSQTVLSVKGLATDAYLHDVSFCLKKGEILGFTGLMGSGRTEVARAVMGFDPVSAGTIEVYGQPAAIRSPVDSARLRMGYVSENREEEGLFKEKNVIFNAAISSLNRYEKRLSLDDSAISRDAVRYNEYVKTKTSSYASSIESLSGGNRQKVIISRSLMKDLDILILTFFVKLQDLLFSGFCTPSALFLCSAPGHFNKDLLRCPKSLLHVIDNIQSAVDRSAYRI